jgi:NADH-quinone oxidoreductase subunit L
MSQTLSASMLLRCLWHRWRLRLAGIFGTAFGGNKLVAPAAVPDHPGVLVAFVLSALTFQAVVFDGATSTRPSTPG